MKTLPEKSKLWFFVIVAVVLHVWAARWPIPEEAGLSARNDSSKPIEIVSGADLPIVQTLRAKKQSEKKKAQFNSEFEQSVERQTQSFRRGLLGQSGRTSAADSPSFSVGADSEFAFEVRPTPGPALRDLMNVGASPNGLPKDIEGGYDTLLNTNAVSHASFFNRLLDEIYVPWCDYAKDAIDTLVVSGQHVGANLYVTRLLISMNTEGRIVAIQTLKSSGIALLDRAPQKALWEQDSFPNPPHQLRDKDGEIRFEYTFTVDYKTSSFSITGPAI